MGPGAMQLRVRQTMLDAGGYWRPLAALARLLEELGELAELTVAPQAPGPDGPDPQAHGPDPQTHGPDPQTAALGSELADLWIITAALADQFLAELPDPPPHPGSAGRPHRYTHPDHTTHPDGSGESDRPTHPESPDRSAAALLPAAGEIARVVNYYDGPKTPRQASALPPLAAAVAAFHQELGALATALGINLNAAVTEKLTAVRASADMRRFDRERSDASTAPVLERLRAAHPETAGLRLWGAPEAGPETLAHALRSFAKACRPERLDGFAIEHAALDGLDPAALGLTVERRGEFLLLRPA